MKIAYVISENLSQESGVITKIKSKIKYWKLEGHEVKVISLKSNNMTSILQDGIILSQYVKEKNLKKKILRRITISKILDDYLSQYKPDIIYSRYISASPDIVPIFKKHAPYIVEINTDDREEFKLGKKSRNIINRLTRNYFLKNASAFISVSKELMSNQNFTKFNKDFIVIGNGYDFEKIKNYKTSFNNKIKFIFIGSPNQPWHGIDKILYMACHFQSYEFHIVGPTIHDLKRNGKVCKNVIAHGYQNHLYLENLIKECDIGIASLALHRNNMNEASPLKSREYLAYGLPIIIGYQDTDIPDDFPYALNIGNYINNVIDNIQNITQFINSFQKISPTEIIKKSQHYLDYKEKEKIRLNFIQKILQKEKTI